MRILFIPIILFANVLSLLASSNMPVEIEVNQTKYVVADSLNSFVFLSLRNTSGEDFIFWTTSRVYTNESQEKKTHDFFMGEIVQSVGLYFTFYMRWVEYPNSCGNKIS